MKNFTAKTIGAVVLSACFFAGCELEVDEKDSLVIETELGEFGGVEPGPALQSAYNDLRAYADQANMYALLEVSSDELLVPTRGTDWGDNGVWRTLHQHSWDPAHQYVLGAWNNLNRTVFRANQIIDPRSNANQEQVAEAKFLRALNMFYVLDLYGQVPFREVDEGPEINPKVFSSSEAFDFIVTDLESAIPDLPAFGPSGETLRASQAAGNFLLAKVLLNKHIYLDTEPQATDMDRVVELVNEIEADGFALEDGFFDIFVDSEDNSEVILHTDASYGNRIWNGLHYHQTVPDNTGGGWNGFSTTAEFYALFEGSPESNTPGSGQEERRGFVPTSGIQGEGPDVNDDGFWDGSHIGFGFLEGQQYALDGSKLNDRTGNPLVYTKEYPGLLGNNERNGIRVLKYHPGTDGAVIPDGPDGSFAPYYIIFRFADAHLMKAEAVLRGGTSSETALQLVNELRELRDADPLANVDLPTLLDERGRELYTEGWRRNDQIRFGTFTETWDMKENTEDFRVLFPIPVTAITSNPNLEQNPGY